MNAFAAVAILLFAAHTIVAQQCVPYTGNFCRNTLITNVSIPLGSTPSMLENKLAGYAAQFQSLSYIAPDCYQASMSLLCMATFNPCSTNTPVPLGTMPCKSSCETANGICAPYFARIAFQFDCSLFPEGQVGVSFPRDCSTVDSKSIELPPCPDPKKLARPPDGGACTLRCDYNYYTDDEDHQLYTGEMTVSVLSMIGSFINIVTYSIFPFKKTHPSNLVLYISMASFGASIGQVMNFMPTDTIHCKDIVTPADTYVPECAIQGVFLHYFPLSVACWWLCIAFNLHQMIVNKNTRSYTLEKYYHIFSWGFPAVFAIIGLSINTYRYSSASFKICFFSEYDATDGLFLVWFIIIGVFGSVLIGHVSYKLYRSYIKMRGVSSVGHNVFRAQMRSYIFMAYYNVIIVSLITFMYYARSIADKGEEDLTNYFACLFGFTSTPITECTYTPAVPFSTVIYTVVVVFGQGLFLFLTFMTTSDTIGCWKALILEGRLDYDPRSFMHKSSSKNLDTGSRGPVNPEQAAVKKQLTAKDIEFSSMQFATSEAKASLGVD